MDTFKALLEAIEAYSDAKAEYKKVSENVRFDRGYFCAREQGELDRAKKQLREALEAHIRHVMAMKEV